MSETPKTVKVFRNGNQLIFYCQFCDKFHKHGVGQGGTGRNKAKHGHRLAHCTDSNSPFKTGGYELREFTKTELKLIKGLAEEALKNTVRK